MTDNCCYSFNDLFRAAHGRDWTEAEREHFNSLSQPEKNAEVRDLVDRTNGEWGCEDRSWSDGKIYTAFWKVVPSQS